MKTKIQKLGSILSSMVMPVIGAFIAWGLITAFFIPTGWIPSERLSELVDPMLKFMLPLLITYTGGKIFYGDRGGVVAVIATMGVIVGTDVPMFLGAMIMAPIASNLMKLVDKILQPKIPTGFEMLVNNFSIGILGFILVIIGFFIVGPLIAGATAIMGAGVQSLIDKNLIFLTSIFIEPAKILFLNNAINHGILTPLGTQMAETSGKSILFLLEANPGPGIGVLLAYMFFGKGEAKATAPGAAVIQFFGGIHEIYFPYVLMKPLLFIAVILGGMAGVTTFSILDAGLVAPASPGSIFALSAMAPQGGLIPVWLGIAVAAIVSFLISSMIIKLDNGDENLQEAKKQVKENKRNISGKANKKIEKIIFACDAGMGSSAMGASIMKKLIDDEDLEIEVTNMALKNLPSNCEFVITQESFKEVVQKYAPNADYYFVKNFLDKSQYEEIIHNLKEE